MRSFGQMVCIFFIAIGAGLFAFGSHLEPRINLADPDTLIRSMDARQNEHHMMASVSSGIGIGLKAFGIMGILIPLAKTIEFRHLVQMSEHSARAIAAVAIWLSIGLVLTFGVCRMNWAGAAAMAVMFALVVVIFAAATAGTALVCGWKPWMRTTPAPLEPAKPSA